jgi:hypothetical protein
MFELNEMERRRIQLEEEYRHEARTALAVQKKPFGQFFGSPLGLWVLSALLLTALPFVYTSVVSHQERERLRRQTVDKLDLELAYRVRLLIQVSSKHVSEGTSLKDRLDLLGGAIAPPSVGIQGTFIFPEFKERSLVSLVSELYIIVDDRDKSQVQQALVAALELSTWVQYGRTHDSSNDSSVVFGTIDSRIAQLQLDRWMLLESIRKQVQQ